MNDRTAQTWAIAILILIVVLAILAMTVVHRYEARQRHKTQPAPDGTHDTERILTAIEGARMQISSTGDELRHQHTTTKERIQWLIGRIDALVNIIAKFVKGIP